MTTHIRATLALVILALAAIPLPGLAVSLTPYKATYDMSYGGVYVGEAVYELEIDGDDNLLFRARVEPRGIAAWISSDIVSEQSRLRLGEDGALVALQYDYLQERKQKPVELKSIGFDWPAGQARTRVDDVRRDVAIEPGTVDRMSLQLKVMLNRIAGNDDKVIAYPVVEDHEVREYRFEVMGHDRIDTAAGRYDTVRLERRHGSRTTIFWSAPALDYLPVRVEQHRSGQATSRMDLSTLKRERTPASR